MWRAELITQFRRRRTKALLLVLAAIPAMLSVAVYLSGGPSAGNGPTFLDQVTHNGVFAALAGLTVTVPFFLPLTSAAVAGGPIACAGAGGGAGRPQRAVDPFPHWKVDPTLGYHAVAGLGPLADVRRRPRRRDVTV